jgi:beta-lactamase class A
VAAEQTWAMVALEGEMLWSHDPDVPFYAASLIKVPLAMAVMKMVDGGMLGLDTPIAIPTHVASPADGSQILIDDDSVDPYVVRHHEAVLPLSCLLERSIIVSSNEATNVLLDLAGFDRVNAVLQRVGSGSSVQRHVFDSVASSAGLTNVATARDYAALLASLYRGDSMSLNSKVYLRSLLLAQQDRVGIPAGTPGVGLNDGVVGGLVGNKTGSTGSVAHDVAFVEPVDAPPYFLAILTGGAPLEDPAASAAIAGIATRAHEMRNR